MVENFPWGFQGLLTGPSTALCCPPHLCPCWPLARCPSFSPVKTLPSFQGSTQTPGRLFWAPQLDEILPLEQSETVFFASSTTL